MNLFYLPLFWGNWISLTFAWFGLIQPPINFNFCLFINIMYKKRIDKEYSFIILFLYLVI